MWTHLIVVSNFVSVKKVIMFQRVHYLSISKVNKQKQFIPYIKMYSPVSRKLSHYLHASVPRFYALTYQPFSITWLNEL